MTVFCISGKARHGKDTVAKIMKDCMQNQGARVLITHYADLLKYVCKQFWGWNGQKDAKGRSLLQYVGTDVVKAQRPDYWIKFVFDMLGFVQGRWDYVLIPDTRFPDEVLLPKSYGFDVVHVRVVRPNMETTLSSEQQNHISETALDGTNVDYLIENTGALADLNKTIDGLLAQWCGQGVLKEEAQ